MMMDTHKRPIRNKISLFNENSPSKIKIHNKRKYHSNNNLVLIKNKIKNKSQNLCSNVIDFIKQKNKFFIENSFDIRGTREFLASKEVAMRTIKLNDEIKHDKEDRIISKTNKNLENLYFMDDENENYEKVIKSAKALRKNSISPRKIRKNHNKKMNKEFNLEIKEISNKKSKKIKRSSKKMKDKSNTTDNKVDSSILDSNSNNSNKKENIIFDKLSNGNDPHSKIYKFFVDNTNENEEHFHKKLKKELKKVENQKLNIDKDKNRKLKRKSLSKKEVNYKIPQKMNSIKVGKNRETQSIFFSEVNRKLMINDDIEVSSIGENNNVNIQSTPKNSINKKKIRKVYSSIKMNDKKIKERIKEKMDNDSKGEKENIYNTVSKMEIKSDKDSIISILSELM